MIRVEISRLDDDVWEPATLSDGLTELVSAQVAALRLSEDGYPGIIFQRAPRNQELTLPLVYHFDIAPTPQPIG